MIGVVDDDNDCIDNGDYDHHHDICHEVKYVS